jgi:ankyrin repeat protein
MSLACSRKLHILALVPVLGMVAAGADTRLADAAQNGDTATVRTLLQQHVDVNAPQIDGATALLWAAHNDDVAAAEMLIRAGANANAANRYGISPIAEAATNGSAAMTELLLKAGADANTTLPEGDTVLMLASRTGNVAVVQALLDHKAEVNAKEGWHGETALMWAAGENHADVVSLLIAHGADPNAQATHLEYPDMKKGPAQVMSSYPSGGLTVLMEAARQDAIEAAKALLKGGVDPNRKDPDGHSALTIAIANAHFDLADLLIENGADPSDGSLVEAVDVRNSDILRAANNRVDQKNVMDIIQALLAHGAKPDSTMPSSMPNKKAFGGGPSVPSDSTAFYRAAKSADLTVMRLLIDKGADAKHALKDGATPLMASAGLGGRGPAGGGEDSGPTEAEMIDAIKLCLDHGADINAVDGTGMTALHGAAQKGKDQVVQFLADHGAKLDLRDKRGRTALDVANGVTGGVAFARPTVHESTVALLRKLMGPLADEPAPKKVAEDLKDEAAAQ